MTRTEINEDILEKICDAVPKYRTFWKNFFYSCSPFDIKTNWENYQSDVKSLQRQDPSTSFEMMQATFYLVAYSSESKK